MEGTISRFIIYFLLYISDPKVERSFVSAHNCDRLENEKIHVCWYIIELEKIRFTKEKWFKNCNI